MEKTAEALLQLILKAREHEARTAPNLLPDRHPNLLPDWHPNRDFFVADILEWALKDDQASLEHPFFSLSKNPDHKIRDYDHNGVHITIAPSAYGMATIWDKDILIYAVGQLIEAMNQERSVSRVVRLKAYDLLIATNRQTSGHSYELGVGGATEQKPGLRMARAPSLMAITVHRLPFARFWSRWSVERCRLS
jgi:hypothetical protein